jgi:Tfp pilus assembly protein PilN
MAKRKTRINFIAPNSRGDALRPSSVALGLAAVAVALPLLAVGVHAANGRFERDRVLQQQRLNELDAELAKRTGERLGGKAAAMQSVEQALKEKVYWADVFKELGNLGPNRVWLTGFNAKVEDRAKKVVISGNSVSQAEIAEFYARLEKSFYFRDLRIKFTESISGINPEIYRFEFEGTLFEPGREVASGKN